MDISNIFKSKTRKALFQLFFTNPEEAFYLRELERMLGIPVAMIRRELIKLREAGIFKTQKRANASYYCLDRSYPLFKELQSIVFKTVGIQGALSEKLKKIPNIDIAFIYGSYAKNESHAGSDVDVFIIGSPDEDVLVESIHELEKQLLRDINYSIFSAADFEQKKKAQEAFIRDILHSPKIILVGSKDVLE